MNKKKVGVGAALLMLTCLAAAGCSNSSAADGPKPTNISAVNPANPPAEILARMQAKQASMMTQQPAAFQAATGQSAAARQKSYASQPGAPPSSN